jgi:long-chain acyl-CoA synthetase
VNLTEPIRRTARERPRQPAIVDGDATLDFRELWSAVGRTAAMLRGRGLEVGDRVLLWLPNGARFLVAHLGAMAAGLLSVPVKAENGPSELSFIARDSKARLLVADRGLLAKLPAGAQPEVPILAADDLPLVGPPADPPPEAVDDDHPASAIYSYFFGEGRPYGAVLTHGNHAFAAEHCSRFHHIEPGDRVLIVLPMLHVFAMGMGILTSFYRGAAVHVGRSVKPRAILETLSRERITHLPGVPQLLEQLARFHDPALYCLGAVKHMTSGADYLPAAVHEWMQATLGVPLIQGYGLTECFPTVCNPPDAGNRPGTLGIGGNPRIHIRIAGESGAELGVGEVGEILLQSPGVMAGYLDAPEATARILRGGWLRTGDLGWLDGEGYLHFHSMFKPILNVAGNKVDPLEVAAVLERLEGVAAARVDGVRADGGGMARPAEQGSAGVLPSVAVRAQVALAPDSRLVERDIRAHCRAWLAPYKVPQRVELARGDP